MRYIAPGKTSTEYRKSLRAELVGLVLIAIGLVETAFAAELLRCVAGVGFVMAGAYLVAHSSSGYARSRGTVKAAASGPTPHRSI